MNRPLFIGVIGGVLVVAAVIWTFFIDRPPDRTETTAASPPVAESGGAPSPAARPGDPSPEATESPESAAPEKTAESPVKPSFDVVRINPQGDAVIAGRAEPHAQVTIRDGDRVIGTVRADSRGEWVQVPETALPPGPRELSLSSKTPDQKEPVESDKKVVLVVPEHGKDIAGRATTDESGALVLAVPRDGSSGVTVLQTPGRHRGAPEAGSGREPLAESVPSGSGETAATTDGEGSGVASRLLPVPGEAPAGETQVARRAGPDEARGAGSGPAPTEREEGLVSRDLTLDAIDYDDSGQLALSGRAKPGAHVRVYLDNEPIGTATAEPSGRWALQPDDRVAAGIYRMRVDQIDANGAVIARIETRFSRAEPLGDLPRDSIVFVQPGNSLWRIARHTYGEGLRYTVIYEANREQIRDPDMIYPGQVFQLPRVN